MIFTEANVYINELKVDDNSIVDFTQSANLFINRNVNLDKFVTFNPSGNNVVVYVDNDFEVDKGSNVTAA